eukprot:CAMPEP_0175956772 /NCGR_PEP_ID=MMETSP0108-20121206/33268_1 /TAXON_ID=195067 ORGANISM="Goniomonas pacifica, Strain CCMP1869" /NCGR_SAMPLE_ID=MMETSP0108 /ASSEMBLY_ACC=CAM_ASM_000204 /LENGTH=30 /DNA_ID= /DNA_START= /DNA_END= /DNA_ORIENTATION=
MTRKTSTGAGTRRNRNTCQARRAPRRLDVL